MHARNLLWPVILIAMCTACQREKTASNIPAPTTPAVAVIGNMTLHETDIDEALSVLPEQMQKRRNDPALRARVLRILLRRLALSQQALAMHLDKDTMIRRRILRARNSILIQSLQQRKLAHLPAPSDKEISNYYNRHIAEFTVPEQVHARHILVSSKKKAGRIIRLLRRGKDFATLAAEYSSDDSNKSRGGDLNWFPRGVMVKPFEKAVFSLKKPGGITGPVKTRFGWHVIELLGRQQASRQTLKEARENIVGILKQQRLTEWVNRIVSQSDARITNPQYRTALRQGDR